MVTHSESISPETLIREGLEQGHVVEVEARGEEYEVRDGKKFIIREASTVVISTPLDVHLKEREVQSLKRIENAQTAAFNAIQAAQEQHQTNLQAKSQETLALAQELHYHADSSAAAAHERVLQQEVRTELQLRELKEKTEVEKGKLVENGRMEVEQIERNSRLQAEREKLGRNEMMEEAQVAEAKADAVHQAKLAKIGASEYEEVMKQMKLEERLETEKLEREAQRIATERDHSEKLAEIEQNQEEELLKMQLAFIEREREQEEMMQQEAAKMRAEFEAKMRAEFEARTEDPQDQTEQLQSTDNKKCSAF